MNPSLSHIFSSTVTNLRGGGAIRALFAAVFVLLWLAAAPPPAPVAAQAPTPSFTPGPIVDWSPFEIVAGQPRRLRVRVSVTGRTITQIEYRWDWDNFASAARTVTGAQVSNVQTYDYPSASCGRIWVGAGITFQNGDVYNEANSIHLPACATSTPNPRRRQSGGSSPRRTPAPDKANLPIPTPDHSQLPRGAEVQSDRPWVASREVSGAAISNPAIRETMLEAIDVWGPMGVDGEVCFDGVGSLILLDAATSPRAQIPLLSYLRADGKTCAGLDRAGTVVLMPGAPSATATPSPLPPGVPPPPTTNPYLIKDNPAFARPLSGCMVTSIDILNFRESPAGNVLSWYAGNSMAVARTNNWFKVEYLGQVGWISAHFVTTSGACA